MAAGDIITDLDATPSVHAFDNTQIENISTTTYVPGSPQVDVTFTAPRSGRVMTIISGGLRDSDGTDLVRLSYEIRENNVAGAVVQPADDSVSSWSSAPTVASNATQFGCRVTLAPIDDFGFITPLTPGNTYFARLMHSTENGSGTADIRNRALTIVPMPLSTHYGNEMDYTMALNRPPLAKDFSGTTQLNVDSDVNELDYGDPEIFTEFIAPTSGRALVVIGGGCRENSVDLGRIGMSVEVRYDGANGHFLVDPRVSVNGLQNFFRYAWTNARGINTSAYQYGMQVGFLGDPATEALEPGRTYFVRSVIASIATDGADIFNRQIFVIPIS